MHVVLKVCLMQVQINFILGDNFILHMTLKKYECTKKQKYNIL